MYIMTFGAHVVHIYLSCLQTKMSIHMKKKLEKASFSSIELKVTTNGKCDRTKSLSASKSILSVVTHGYPTKGSVFQGLLLSGRRRGFRTL